MTKQLYTDVQINGNPMNILSVEVTEGYKQTTARCSIETENISSINLNQTVTIDLGFSDDHGQVFVGYIDDISESRMPGTYRIECRDVLKRAIEHFIVTADLQNPWSRSNIQAEDLVRDLLAEAGITAYSGEVTSFTFGTQYPAEFNLMSSWDAINMICNILAYHCYAENGTVYFKRIFPVPGGSASKSFSVGDSGNITFINYGYNTDNLRNKVVVFGKPPIHAEASTPSPHLPSGFYKTAIVSSELIDTQDMADQSAQYNLQLYNKLTEFARLDAEGNHAVRCRHTVSVTEPFTGMSGTLWFIYSITHRIDESGYKISLNLAK